MFDCFFGEVSCVRANDEGSPSESFHEDAFFWGIGVCDCSDECGGLSSEFEPEFGDACFFDAVDVDVLRA